MAGYMIGMGGGMGKSWGGDSAGGGSSSKGLVSTSGLGGGIAGLLSGAITPAAATSTSNTTQTQNSQNMGQAVTSKDSVSKQTGTIASQTLNMSPAALAELEALITGKKKDPLLANKDRAASSNIASLQSLLAGLNPAQAEQRASGRTAQLSRELTEQVLPELFGRTEAAGFGTNALSQLLAQDAAVRTAEAQNRAVEEAYFNTVNAGIQGAGTMGTLTSGTSASSQAMLEALGIAKGAMTSGIESRDLTTTGSEIGTTVSNEASTTTGSSSSSESKVDPHAWANTLASLLSVQLQKPKEASANEKALSAFMAAGGDPGALNRHTANDYGYGLSQNRLWNSIASKLGAR